MSGLRPVRPVRTVRPVRPVRVRGSRSPTGHAPGQASSRQRLHLPCFLATGPRAAWHGKTCYFFVALAVRACSTMRLLRFKFVTPDRKSSINMRPAQSRGHRPPSVSRVTRTVTARPRGRVARAVCFSHSSLELQAFELFTSHTRRANLDSARSCFKVGKGYHGAVRALCMRPPIRVRCTGFRRLRPGRCGP